MFVVRRLPLLLFLLHSALVIGAAGEPAKALPSEIAPENRSDDASKAPGSESSARSEVPWQAMLLLKQQCFGCHNDEKKKGGLIMTSRQTLLDGGENGPVLLPGKSAESRLTQLVLPGADPHMPPKHQLADAEITLLRRWIDEGAAWSDKALAADDAEPLVEQLGSLPASYQPVLALALSADGRKLAVGRGSDIWVHDAAATNHAILGHLAGQLDLVQSLAWSLDGKKLASGGFRRALIWDAEKMELEQTITNMSGRITALVFARDNATLIIAEGPAAKPSSIARRTPGQTATKWKAHRDTILDLQISPDGRQIASASADKLVKLWDFTSHAEVAQLEGHTGPVLAMAFKPDGSLLATAGADKEVKIWDLKTMEQTKTIGRHSAGINDLAWTSDGKKIVTICEDGTVRICDESKDSPERTLPSADDLLYAVTVSTDGKTIYAGAHDGRVYVWRDGKLLTKIGPQENASGAEL